MKEGMVDGEMYKMDILIYYQKGGKESMMGKYLGCR